MAPSTAWFLNVCRANIRHCQEAFFHLQRKQGQFQYLLAGIRTQGGIRQRSECHRRYLGIYRLVCNFPYFVHRGHSTLRRYVCMPSGIIVSYHGARRNGRFRTQRIWPDDRRLRLDLKELLGFIGGLLTTVGFVPQVWRLFRLKSAHEISLIFTSFFVIGIAFWLSYGIVFGLPSVTLWNAVTLALGFCMLYAKLKYGR